MNRTVKAKGYTKAVDMWSTGCVTSALLTGCSLFGSSNVSDSGAKAEEVFLRAAAECDLQRLDNGEEWKPIGQPPKDFVKRLLTLDEVVRMTASEALDHHWFSHPHYKENFDALYKKAVGVWKPRLAPTGLIKKIGHDTKKSKFFFPAVLQILNTYLWRLIMSRILQNYANLTNYSLLSSLITPHAIKMYYACSTLERKRNPCQRSM